MCCCLWKCSYLYAAAAQLLQSCPTLCDPMGCSPPGSPVHGNSPARILESVAMPSSRTSSWPRDQTHISCVSCIACRWIFYLLSHWGNPSVCVCVCVGVYLCVCTINRNSFYLDFMDFLIYLLDFFDVLIGSQTCLNHTEHQSLFTIQISDILCGGKTGNITVRKNYPHIASMLSNCMHPAWHTQGREMV